MAAIMMTPSRFGGSVSGFQQPYSTNAPSMADTLPSIDFNFADLRERMARFTVRFDDFIEKGRKRVLEERNQFRMSVGEIEETKRNRQQQIAEFESMSSTHAQILEKELQETEEMHAAIDSLTEQKSHHEERRDDLKSQNAAVQSSVKQRREAQQQHQRALDAQARHNVPELRFWENMLCLRIEGTGGEDRLRFVFSDLGGMKSDSESWFELKMGGKEYGVTTTKPKLDSESLGVIVERLNETRELRGFLKEMRGLFVEAL